MKGHEYDAERIRRHAARAYAIVFIQSHLVFAILHLLLIVSQSRHFDQNVTFRARGIATSYAEPLTLPRLFTTVSSHIFQMPRVRR